MTPAGPRVVADGASCPCGSSKPYGECCGPCHGGLAPATTAEALMRSRYSAFSLGQVDYLLDTLHPDLRRPGERADLERSIASTEWTGLRIVATRAGGADDDHGEVEFVATFRRAGLPGHLHERSRFERLAGRWLYHSGETEGLAPVCEPGRNDPCWCGSGKKLKKCHGKSSRGSADGRQSSP